MTEVKLLMISAAGEDTAVTDEDTYVGQAGCVTGKPDRPSSPLCSSLSTLFHYRDSRGLLTRPVQYGA